MPKADTIPAPSRRALLAGLPLAAAAAGISSAVTASSSPDADLIQLCERHIANWQLANSGLPEAEDGPIMDAFMASTRAISDARPMTLAGLAAKARAAKVEAQQPDGEDNAGGMAPAWAWDLVNDLIVLAGGVA